MFDRIFSETIKPISVIVGPDSIPIWASNLAHCNSPSCTDEGIMRIHYDQSDPNRPGGALVTGGLRDFLLGPKIFRNGQDFYNHFIVILLDLGKD